MAAKKTKNWVQSIPKKALLEHLKGIYSIAVAEQLADAICILLKNYQGKIKAQERFWVDQSDVMLITYGDTILDNGRSPLFVLAEFLQRHTGDVIPNVHILPFYPYSSDDGFSVIDFRKVNPQLGTWDDIAALSEKYDLMFDGVINHVSRQSDWFKAFSNGEPEYADYFLVSDPELDYSKVIRPRTLPLLTAVDTASGKKQLWTTFSADQIDLNYKNPKVLIEILDLLLFYAARGARFIRLDAICFMWKEPGTDCLHLPQTHSLIQLMRQVLDAAVSGTLLITETNVPHKENIRYFGNGDNEAHLVYQFPLPPLTVHAFQTGDARRLTEWAASLDQTSLTTTYFNFLASHDGIGLRPVEKILSREEINAMAEQVRASGGRVSMRNTNEGKQEPYELNISYLDAVCLKNDNDETRTMKFLAAHTILLSLAGVPGIYIHSLLGSRNDLAGVHRTGHNRSINRQQLELVDIETDLNQPKSLRYRVFHGLMRLIKIRREMAAFHPNAAQKVLNLDDRIFSIIRENAGNRVVSIVNVSNKAFILQVSKADLGVMSKDILTDLISDRSVGIRCGMVDLRLQPYQVLWITC